MGAAEVPIRMLMEAYRCTMVTIAQVAEGQEVEAGTRPHGHEVTKIMKRFLAKDSDTHGPLPRDNPNFAVFAAPGVDQAILRTNDVINVCDRLESARSLWEFNERLSAFNVRPCLYPVSAASLEVSSLTFY